MSENKTQPPDGERTGIRVVSQPSPDESELLELFKEVGTDTKGESAEFFRWYSWLTNAHVGTSFVSVDKAFEFINTLAALIPTKLYRLPDIDLNAETPETPTYTLADKTYKH